MMCLQTLFSAGDEKWKRFDFGVGATETSRGCVLHKKQQHASILYF